MKNGVRDLQVIEKGLTDRAHLKDFLNTITLEELRLIHPKGKFKGMSVFMRILFYFDTSFYAAKNVRYVLSLIKKHAATLTIEDYRLTCQKDAQELTCFWLFLRLCRMTRLENFEPILSLILKQTTVADFTKLPLTSDVHYYVDSELICRNVPWEAIFKYLSLDLTINHIVQIVPDVFDHYTSELQRLTLSQLPGMVNSAVKRLKWVTDVDGKIGNDDLIQKRNALTLCLQQKDQDREKLTTLAHEATKAGYHNAFFDLGKYYDDNMQIGLARQAYQGVPQSAFNYSRAQERRQELIMAHATELFGRSLNNQNINHRNNSLSNALVLLIPLTKDEYIIALMRRICISYITDGKDDNPNISLITDSLLHTMHGEGSDIAKWSMSLLELLKIEHKRRLLEQQNLIVLEGKLASLEEQKRQVDKALEQNDGKDILAHLTQLVAVVAEPVMVQVDKENVLFHFERDRRINANVGLNKPLQPKATQKSHDSVKAEVLKW
jgi:hypothetical protein